MPKAKSTVGAVARTHTHPDETLLLLSCMDRRLMDEIVEELDRHELTDKYDHVILAGASLGAVSARFPHWGRTFYEHLALARDLHGVRRVVLLDHRDCGAYERLLGLHLSEDREREREVHLAHQQKLRRKIHALDPSMQVECWLMDLNGEVEDLTAESDLWLPGITERRRKPRTHRKPRASPPRSTGRARPRR